MTSIINSLIDEREEEIRSAKAKKEAEYTAAVEKLLSEMKEFLGDFWKLLEERASRTGEKYIYKIETYNDDTPTRIHYQIPAIPEEELAPILIAWGVHALHPSYYDHSQKFKIAGYHYSDLKAALRAARVAYPEYLKKIRDEKISNFEEAMNWNRTPNNTTLESREEILSAHLEEFKDDPEECERARRVFAYWKEKQEKYIAEIEEARREAEKKIAAEALRKTIAIKYIMDLAEWLQQDEKIREWNKARAAEIQELNDSNPYPAYKLSYAIASEYTEDGELEHILETRSVYLHSDKRSGQYWNVTGRKINFLQAYEIESLSVVASSGILARHVQRYGIDFYFHPAASEEEIEGALSILRKTLDRPELPDELRHWYDIRTFTKTAEIFSESGGMIDPLEALDDAWNRF